MCILFLSAFLSFNLAVAQVDTVTVASPADTLVKDVPMTVIPVPEDEPVMRPQPIPHLKFKGIPLSGSPEVFGLQLVRKGYRNIQGLHYSGPFAGVENAHLFVSCDEGSVWKVTVVFPPCHNWLDAKNLYAKFKNWIAWKYVTEPVMVRERLTPKFKEGCGQEAWGFEMGVSVYECTFDFAEGTIVPRIVYDKPSSGLSVCIDYIDRVNSIIKEEKDMEDL